MSDNKAWDYRVVRKESVDSLDEWYSIQEVYYDGDGQPMAQTIDLMVDGDTIMEMRIQLELMLKSLEEPVLDESDITSMPPVETKTIEERILGLKMENAEMRDRLTELGDEYSGKIRENMENLRTGKKTAAEDVPLPQGTDYHGDGKYYSKWSRKEEKDNKDV